jgi:hypothetical protein
VLDTQEVLDRFEKRVNKDALKKSHPVSRTVAWQSMEPPENGVLVLRAHADIP